MTEIRMPNIEHVELIIRFTKTELHEQIRIMKKLKATLKDSDGITMMKRNKLATITDFLYLLMVDGNLQTVIDTYRTEIERYNLEHEMKNNMEDEKNGK